MVTIYHFHFRHVEEWCFGARLMIRQLATMRFLISLALFCFLARTTFAAGHEEYCEYDETVAQLITRLKAMMEKLKIKASIEGLIPAVEVPIIPPLVITTPAVEIFPPEIPRDCKDNQILGLTTSGLYPVVSLITDNTISVFCDMETLNGGWTIIQRRNVGLEIFDRTFLEYAEGFGSPTGEMWIGNDILAAMTASKPYELLIILRDFDGEERIAKYGTFAVKGADEAYALKIGDYTGTAGDSMSYHNGARFSTFDTDNDASSSRNCAEVHHGGWWFKNCLRANLNGLYLGGDHDSYADGIEWARFRGLKYSLKETIMMIRPRAI